jgi:hypothetical protein
LIRTVEFASAFPVTLRAATLLKEPSGGWLTDGIAGRTESIEYERSDVKGPEFFARSIAFTLIVCAPFVREIEAANLPSAAAIAVPIRCAPS